MRALCVFVLFSATVGCSLDAKGVSSNDDLGDAHAPVDSTIEDFGVDSFVAPDTATDPDTTTDADLDTLVDDTTPIDTAPEAPLDVASTCASTDVAWGGHCYFLVKTSLDWNAARDACVASGAHLATFTLDGEMAAAGALCAHDECWIDLVADHSTKTPTDFRWDDGESPVNGTWCGSEPSGDGTDTSACARLKSGGTCFADAPCAMAFFYLCERE